MHYVLYGITRTRHSFNLIAVQILKKWEPIFRSEIRNVRWVYNANSLEYISSAKNDGKKSIDILIANYLNLLL